MSSSSSKVITVHTGFFFRTMTIGVAQTVITHNIGKNINLEDLEASVHRLVDRNPILSGTLFFGNKQTGPGVFVETGKYDSFVHVLPTPAGIPSPKSICNNASELEAYVKANIEPLIPPSKKGTEELKEKLPLFGVHVMQLPDGYVYYAPRVSHAIGDGRVYYMLVEELNCILNKKPMPPPITWESKEATVFDFTHQVTNPTFWFSMIMMLIVYAVCGFPETQKVMLSTNKIKSKKKELARTGSYLSTNDVVSAAVCEGLSRDFDYVNQSVDYRSRWSGAGERDGGNVTRLVPFDTKRGSNPNEIRMLVDSIASDPNKSIPFWSTCLGRGYNQTNWANIQQTLDGTIYHSPMQSVVDVNDIPILIIYQPNENEIGIMHKFKNLNPSVGLLSELSA